MKGYENTTQATINGGRGGNESGHPKESLMALELNTKRRSEVDHSGQGGHSRQGIEWLKKAGEPRQDSREEDKLRNDLSDSKTFELDLKKDWEEKKENMGARAAERERNTLQTNLEA